MHRVLFPSEGRRYWEHKALLGQFVNSGDLVFDVGANIGNRVEILLSPGATVVAFEPQPICVRELLALDDGHLTVIQKAVGEFEDNATFYFANPGDALASDLPNWGDRVGTSSMSVAVTTLDKAIEQFGVPKFCKIDVEGFEVEVLRGLSRAILFMTIEYQSGDPRGIAKIAECLAIMAKLGAYKVNLVGLEEATLLLPKWLSIPDFLRALPGCSGGHPHGDLFLTTTME